MHSAIAEALDLPCYKRAPHLGKRHPQVGSPSVFRGAFDLLRDAVLHPMSFTVVQGPHGVDFSARLEYRTDRRRSRRA